MNKEELKPIDVTKFTITECGNVLRSKTMKEELEKEANKYADDYATPDLDCSFRAYMFEASKEGYLAGAEPREKRIADLEAEKKEMTIKIDRLESACDAYNYSQRTYQEEIKELKAQIEKMKCCRNCVHFDFTEPNYCHKGIYRANQNVCGEWCFGN